MTVDIDAALGGRMEVLQVLHDLDPFTEREKLIALTFLTLIDSDESPPVNQSTWSKKARRMHAMLTEDL